MMFFSVQFRSLNRYINLSTCRRLSISNASGRPFKIQHRRPFVKRSSKFNFLGKATENSYIYGYICNRFQILNDSSFLSEVEKEVNMSHNQFLESLYQIILKREKSDVMSDYESQVLTILEKPTIEDLSIICLAYFKTHNQISNHKILREVLKKTIKLVPTIDFKQPGFCAIIKSVRYTRDLQVRPLVVELIDILLETSSIKSIFANPFNAVHIIKLMETYRIYNTQLLNLVYKTVFINLTDYRIKDIQYILTSLSNFRFKVDEKDDLKRNLDVLCKDIVTESRRDVDLQYPHLLPILRAFLIFDYHDDEILRYINTKLNDPVLSKEILTTLEGPKTALLLFVTSRLLNQVVKFMPQEKIAKKLSSKITRNLGNIGSVKTDSSLAHLNFILNNKDKENLVIKNLFRKVATSLALHNDLKDPVYKLNFQFTFPHQNFTDLIVSKASEAPGHFDPETLLPRKIPMNQRHCVVLALRDFDFVDGKNRLSGYKTMITLILKQIGYRVVYVDIDKYNVEELVKEVVSTLD